MWDQMLVLLGSKRQIEKGAQCQGCLGSAGHKVLLSEGSCEKREAGPGDTGCKDHEASRRGRRPGAFLWDRKGRGRKDGGSGGGDGVAGFQRCLRATSSSGTETQGARSGPCAQEDKNGPLWN